MRYLAYLLILMMAPAVVFAQTYDEQGREILIVTPAMLVADTPADNECLTYDLASLEFRWEACAPTDAEYIVAEAHAGLSAEVAPGAADQVPRSSSSTAAAWTSVPDCNTENMLTYSTGTHTFGCEADTGGGGSTPTGTGYRHVTAGAEDAAADTVTFANSSEVQANQGTTITLLHGNAAGQPTFGSAVSADLNITTTSCTNQFVTAISAGAVGTCTTDTLASAQHANQGTTTQALHGNAAGNPAWGAVVFADTTGIAPNNAEYIVSEATADLSAEVAPGAANQVPVSSSSTAAAWGTVPDAALTSNYSGVGACGASTWASTLNDNAAPTCTQPAFSNISSTLALAQITDDGTSGRPLLSGGGIGDPNWGVVLSVPVGGTGSAPAADDQALISNSTVAATWRSIPDCNTNNMLTYTQATNTFGCDADDGGGGGGLSYAQVSASVLAGF